MTHIYYCVSPINCVRPGKPEVFGTYMHAAQDPNIRWGLYAHYLRELGNDEPGRYDGASLVVNDNGESRVRILVGSNGTGTKPKIIEVKFNSEGEWERKVL